MPDDTSLPKDPYRHFKTAERALGDELNAWPRKQTACDGCALRRRVERAFARGDERPRGGQSQCAHALGGSTHVDAVIGERSWIYRVRERPDFLLSSGFRLRAA